MRAIPSSQLQFNLKLSLRLRRLHPFDGNFHFSTKPLDNLLVVSLEQAIAAPYCSVRLRDAGARVIKIEKSEGDSMRHLDRDVRGLSANFVWVNRGKESVVLDIKKAADIALIRRMLARADVWIQNMGPGVAEKCGLGSQALRKEFPRLITCDISGYGTSSDYQQRKAYDLLVQAEAGIASLTGSPDEIGCRVGVSVCDIACGMNAYSAILEAIISRGRTNRGLGISISLFDSIAEWMNVPFLQHYYSAKTPSKGGMHHPTIRPYGLYHTQTRGVADKPVLIAIQNEGEFTRFCRIVLEREELLSLESFNSTPLRLKNCVDLDAIINSVFSAIDREELVRRLVKAQLGYGDFHNLAQFSQHKNLKLMTIQSTDSETIKVIPPPSLPHSHYFSSLESTVGPLLKLPQLGEHTSMIRDEFNCE